MSNIEVPPSSATTDEAMPSLIRLLRAVDGQWYRPWKAQWSATRIADGPAVRFDPEACRAWLAEGAGARLGIDDGFCATELSIPAGLEVLLGALDEEAQPQVWAPHPVLRQVQVWRTADGDGVDGGAIITADLLLGGDRVRLATLHQGFDEFTTHGASAGIDAAIEALGHVADLVNTELDVYRRTIAAPNGHTVIGGWDEDQPMPVAVVVARLTAPEASTAVIQHARWWAVAVHTADPDEAQTVAIALMRTTVAG